MQFGQTIPTFRGVFMRDTLPIRPLLQPAECGIINLDDSNGAGTHWTAYFKDNDNSYYFDSFGLPPPNEIAQFLGRPITYNTFQVQKSGDTICGQLCLYVLQQLYQKRQFKDVVLELI